MAWGLGDELWGRDVSEIAVLICLDLVLTNYPYMGTVTSMSFGDRSCEQSPCSDNDAKSSSHLTSAGVWERGRRPIFYEARLAVQKKDRSYAEEG